MLFTRKKYKSIKFNILQNLQKISSGIQMILTLNFDFQMILTWSSNNLDFPFQLSNGLDSSLYILNL